MKSILVVCPYERDRRELSRDNVKNKYSIIFDEMYTKDWLEKIICDRSGEPLYDDITEVIERVIAYYNGIDGIVSSGDYPGSIVSAIIAYKMNKLGVDPGIILRAHHKYYSRLDQHAIVPECVPQFRLFSNDGTYIHFKMPCFLKPVKSYFSMYAYKINFKEELHAIVQRVSVPTSFLMPFNQLLKEYTTCNFDANCWILEEFIEGEQVTLEGCVYKNEVYFLGITDSYFYPGTFVFSRFEYPSKLPDNVRNKMKDISTKIVTSIGLNNSLFNIEFIYNKKTDRIYIVEINPRMASQFADLYEKVDGVNSYDILLDLSVGEKPQFQSGKGAFSHAIVFVLRVFKDYAIRKMPSRENIIQLQTLFPDVRIELYGQEGKKLSKVLQDGKSFRYACVHLGGNSRNEVFEKLKECKKLLTFQFT